MTLIVNGVSEPHEPCSIVELLSRKNFPKEQWASLIVERNFAILPHNSWASTWLAEDDRIEILKLMGGG